MQCFKAEVGGMAHSGAPGMNLPDSLTLTNLGLAPALQPGRDVLGFGAAHRMMSAAHVHG